MACVGGHWCTVSLLLSWRPAQLAATDRHGRGPLHLAASHGHSRLTELLLAEGAAPADTDHVSRPRREQMWWPGTLFNIHRPETYCAQVVADRKTQLLVSMFCQCIYFYNAGPKGAS